MRFLGTIFFIALVSCVVRGAYGEPPAESRDRSGFLPRLDVEHVIKYPRSPAEDLLRLNLLMCAQSDDELDQLAGIVNGRWDKSAVELLGTWLLEDWDKAYGPSLRRPTSVFPLLVFIRNNEKAYAYSHDGQTGVTATEGQRVESLPGVVDKALLPYFKKLGSDNCPWPRESRENLFYNVVSTFEEYASPDMITEPIWEAMAKDTSFRFGMLGVMSNVANQTTLDRLIQFRNSRVWESEDMRRLDMALVDTRWWLDREARMAELRPQAVVPKPVVSEEETKLLVKRLADARSKRCPRLKVVSDSAVQGPLADLCMAYTILKSPVASTCEEGSDVKAIGSFVTDSDRSPDLLILDGEPSEQALTKFGREWEAVAGDREQPLGDDRQNERLFAGRAVAIVVNATNKLESLPLSQLQAIGSGEVKDWSLVDGSQLKPRSGAAGRMTINFHCPPLNDPTMAILAREVLPQNTWGRLAVKRTTGEILGAVSVDPYSIGVVDLASVPTSGQTVRILGIQTGLGPAAKAVKPSPATIRDGSYPLSQRLYLHVHPRASDAAKDFATFVMTCGASEANPYTDTMKGAMDAYSKHGLFPLTEAAIARMASDAAEPATAKREAPNNTRPPQKPPGR